MPIETTTIRPVSRHAGRVLLAADDGAFRALVATALRHEGHGVIEAEDGYELADQVEVSIYRRGLRPTPDVIVSETTLPGLSPLLILEQLRGERIDTPMIFVSALLDKATRAKAFRLGAMAVLDKPFATESLCRLVARAVRARAVGAGHGQTG